ncbi:unnamed protein product [Rangifer tarandus platyrhynchus]|uniref:Uncharacterized protein n=2 Tax=Rangifer tarandus platyrhynchus TaxID=3082113 RepID=A0ABN8ZHK0_RANTA|nr:unnamed protein product [Rangifer tarandus platyrhynchus]CAI9705877.1 unnamed protein product [Rangifer tarandus platyrhynchus]
MVNFVTLGQPPQGPRGVRLGTRPYGRQRSSAGPTGWGHCRPRAALRPPPAPGARVPPRPGVQLSPPPRPPLSLGPQALTNLPAGMQRRPIRAPDNPPSPARSHLRLGIENFRDRVFRGGRLRLDTGPTGVRGIWTPLAPIRRRRGNPPLQELRLREDPRRI